jgi:hypothetical protein
MSLAAGLQLGSASFEESPKKAIILNRISLSSLGAHFTKQRCISQGDLGLANNFHLASMGGVRAVHLVFILVALS